jgi:hypothetical protein
MVLALKRCIENKFSESDWDEVAYLTDGKEIIYGHDRLLRSLSFGDADYASCIFDVVEGLVRSAPENLKTLINYTNLPQWLQENDPARK